MYHQTDAKSIVKRLDSKIRRYIIREERKQIRSRGSEMNRKNWKFFLIIGALLILAGFVVYSNDPFIGILGTALGAYNVFKGIRLKRGIQPLIIREHQKRERENKKEVQNKMSDSKRNKNNQQNRN